MNFLNKTDLEADCCPLTAADVIEGLRYLRPSLRELCHQHGVTIEEAVAVTQKGAGRLLMVVHKDTVDLEAVALVMHVFKDENARRECDDCVEVLVATSIAMRRRGRLLLDALETSAQVNGAREIRVVASHLWRLTHPEWEELEALGRGRFLFTKRPIYLDGSH